MPVSSTNFLVNHLYGILIRAIARGDLGALTPLFGKRSSKIESFTSLIRLFCIYLALFNIIIPKHFQPCFTQHIFTQILNFLSMHIQNFFWGGGFKGTNLVMPSLCIHVCIKVPNTRHLKLKSLQGPKADPRPQPT